MEINMYEKEKLELMNICHLLYERNLVTASDGNISVRISEEHILLTPSGRNKGMLQKEEILVLDGNGNTIQGEGRASKEYPMHKEIYRRRQDVKAVVHTHPVYATAFALAGKNLPDNYLIESRMMLGRTALADYAAPGTPALAAAAARYAEECNAILLRNHGALTLGKNLMDAFQKMEVMESIAKTIILSRLIGEPEPISEENMAAMKRS